jgi:hypothetical protein
MFRGWKTDFSCQENQPVTPRNFFATAALNYVKARFAQEAQCWNAEAPVQEKPALGLRNCLTLSGQCRIWVLGDR